jgi:hypothetical protein
MMRLLLTHGCPIDCLGRRLAANPSGHDIDAWGEDVNEATPVGKVCPAVIDIGSANRDGQWLTPGRAIVSWYLSSLTPI